MWPSPIVINSNWYVIFNAQNIQIGVPQALQAAKLTHGILHFKKIMENETLPQEFMGKLPLCMNQYTPIFTTMRHPGEKEDTLVKTSTSNKLVILRRGHYWSLEVLDSQGNPNSILDIADAIQEIINNTEHTSPRKPSIGTLTADERPHWAKARAMLLEKDVNKTIMNTIQQALFILCLDDDEPKGDEETSQLCFHSNAHNRFYDKVFQIIVFKNGRAGFNGEHSPMDAPAMAHMLEIALEYLSSIGNNFGSKASSTPKATPLHWVIPDEVEKEMKVSHARYTKELLDSDLKVLQFREYGTDYIKSRGISPDSIAQYSMQLAYFRVHGKLTATYETGHTRAFYHGRTDVVRVCSSEGLEWVKAMCDTTATPGKRAKLFDTAIQYHRKFLSDVVSGKGIDRHILGLKLIATMEHYENGRPMDKIFSDPLMSKSTNFLLSTSNVPIKELLPNGGFGCMYPEGYGICYQLHKNSLHYSIHTRRCCKETDSEIFKEALIASLRDIKELLEYVHTAKSKL
eukprot:TRINITY_DN5417_c0_g1_i1.p1 TRINITY_DN5417_c0_g1~~TRINITY_DN5417_c0_g1_i1.p1  ORF type:complete len:515 (+),score=95.52 TRINITY_DN5417_c0_g1_i1:281-1825(+)